MAIHITKHSYSCKKFQDRKLQFHEANNITPNFPKHCSQNDQKYRRKGKFVGGK